MTRLGQHSQLQQRSHQQRTEPDEAPSAASRLAQAIAGGAVRGRLVELPILGAAYIELVGAAKANAIDVAAVRVLQAEGVDADASMAALLLEGERALRTLAVAVRDPDDHAQPYGTLAEWGALDPSLVTACWHVYSDVSEELDPGVQPLTPAQITTIGAAVAKKNFALLRSFGTNALASYLLSTAEQPATSPTPTLPPGPSSPET